MGYYLATTGLSDYWKLDQDILFLGSWCLSDEKNKSRLKSDKVYLNLPCPWRPAEDIKLASDYCHDICKKLHPQIAKSLNEINQTNHSDDYWELVGGYWLYQFVDVLFERYIRIKKACETYPDFVTNILPLESGALAVFDTRSFVASATDDYYNLKLFSRIIAKICPEKAEVQSCRIDKIDRPLKFCSYKMMLNKILKLFRIFFSGEVFLTYMQPLTFFDKMRLQIKSSGRLIRFTDFKEFEIEEKKFPRDSYNPITRKKITLSGAEDEFQKLLFELIPEAIPLCFVENYEFYQQSINNIRHLKSIKVVGSIAGFYYFEGIKFLTAELREQGAKLIEFQHGGSYGQALCNPAEKLYEQQKKFYHWGWAENGSANYRRLPGAQLSKLRDTHQTRNNQILYIGTSNPRYCYRLQTQLLPEDMQKYFADTEIFLNELSEKLINCLIFRPYLPDFGWGTVDRMKKNYPKMLMMLTGKTIEVMKKVKLVVIDHPITSMLEALVINVPCVFFWDHDVYLMRPTAIKYFGLLEAAGIVHRAPESAARKVNEISADPLAWWLTADVQKARKIFCEKFAYTSTDWMNLWIQEIKRLTRD